jgi:hypothetical protein
MVSLFLFELAVKKTGTSSYGSYNPTYSGGSDQEDWGLKPAQPSSSWDPISKNPSQ